MVVFAACWMLLSDFKAKINTGDLEDLCKRRKIWRKINYFIILNCRCLKFPTEQLRHELHLESFGSWTGINTGSVNDKTCAWKKVSSGFEVQWETATKLQVLQNIFASARLLTSEPNLCCGIFKLMQTASWWESDPFAIDLQATCRIPSLKKLAGLHVGHWVVVELIYSQCKWNSAKNIEHIYKRQICRAETTTTMTIINK